MRSWIALSFALMVCAKLFADDQSQLSHQFQAIEAQVGGRLGVSAFDTGSGRRIEYHAADRFPMCSTFKFLLVAAVLQKDGRSLDERIAYGTNDLVEWAPVTGKHLAERAMTIKDLCAATMIYSDNAAANLLIRHLGGPTKVTEYVRSLGDTVTRLDRTEPSLNSAIRGDERDTSTPRAMVSDLNLLLLGDRLPSDARSQLETWLQANTTGKNRIRAGLPTDWRVGDKTGTGDNGTANDIAIVRPPNRSSILIAIYLTQSSATADQLNASIAKAASLVAQAL